MSKQPHLPEKFLAHYITHHEVAGLMGRAFGAEISESVFLALCASGKVPVPGVSLRPINGALALVFDRAAISAWASTGFPLRREILDYESNVRTALRLALEEIGETLPEPANPVTPMELN